eukprot:10647143-Heterocapsa_arctica.AAC.1
MTSELPTDLQLLKAREEYNLSKRRVLKADVKHLKAQKDAATAKDEVAAAKAAHDAEGVRLEKLEKAIKALTEQAKADPTPSESEWADLRKMRELRAGQKGAQGTLPYQQAMWD